MGLYERDGEKKKREREMVKRRREKERDEIMIN